MDQYAQKITRDKGDKQLAATFMAYIERVRDVHRLPASAEKRLKALLRPLLS